jgi:hypothetical protein
VREADHSPPSSAEVKNAWSYTSTPQYAFMAWCLVKNRDNFTFTISQVQCSCVHFYVLNVIVGSWFKHRLAVMCCWQGNNIPTGLAQSSATCFSALEPHMQHVA